MKTYHTGGSGTTQLCRENCQWPQMMKVFVLLEKCPQLTLHFSLVWIQTRSPQLGLIFSGWYHLPPVSQEWHPRF